jgi:hypothetical protein
MLTQGKAEAFESNWSFGQNHISLDGVLSEIPTYDGTERRKHPRFKVNWKGVLECISSASRTTIRVIVLDISEGGCSLRLEKDSAGCHPLEILASDKRFELTLIPREIIPRIAVEVRWYMPIGGGGYGAGLEFISMTRKNHSLLLAALQKLEK